MLKRQAIAFVTARTDEESQVDMNYEGRPNLEDGQKYSMSLAAGFPPSESTSGQATGRTDFKPPLLQGNAHSFPKAQARPQASVIQL